MVGFIKNTANTVGLFAYGIAGIAVIVGASVLSAIYIPIQTLAVLAAAIGTAAGTILVCKAYSIGSRIKSPEARNMEEIERAKRELEAQLKTKEKELAQALHDQKRAKHENRQLQSEKERLERMKISSQSVSPILKLGLLSAKLSLHDFYRKVLRDDSSKRSKIGIDRIELFKNEISYYEEFVGMKHMTLEAT
ncbi:hypothetical protein FACS1894103_5110 [Campylobacterota bacterium]|nr:hypothetical protein FACS1894103_5110 [Campylobacterota bacterium]